MTRKKTCLEKTGKKGKFIIEYTQVGMTNVLQRVFFLFYFLQFFSESSKPVSESYLKNVWNVDLAYRHEPVGKSMCSAAWMTCRTKGTEDSERAFFFFFLFLPVCMVGLNISARFLSCQFAMTSKALFVFICCSSPVPLFVLRSTS